jgi:hypothetical protein
MTATTIDGVEVVASEPAMSPLSEVHGQAIHYKQILKLLLADGRELFGCAHCDYTSTSVQRVYPHLKKHSPRPPRQATAVDPAGLDMTVGELLKAYQQITEMADAYARLADDRDEWKSRARKAEGQLGTLRKALGAIGGGHRMNRGVRRGDVMRWPDRLAVAA